MDYTKITDEQRDTCIRMLGTLLGRALNAKDAKKFSGQARVADLVARQEFANILTSEQDEVASSY